MTVDFRFLGIDRLGRVSQNSGRFSLGTEKGNNNHCGGPQNCAIKLESLIIASDFKIF